MNWQQATLTLWYTAEDAPHTQYAVQLLGPSGYHAYTRDRDTGRYIRISLWTEGKGTLQQAQDLCELHQQQEDRHVESTD